MVTTTMVILAAIFAAAPAKNQKGREEFERAASYYKAQEYEAALPLFQQAYELSGHRPSTIRALAQCERSLKMYDEAVVHFREYLATKPSAQEARSVKKTIDLLSEIKASREWNAVAAKKNSEELEHTPDLDAAPIETAKPAEPVELPFETAKPVERPPEQHVEQHVEQRVEQRVEKHVEQPVVHRELNAPSYTPPARAQPEVTRVETEPERSTVLPWTTIGASTAIAIAGGTLLAVGLGDMHQVEAAPDGTPYHGALEEAANRAPTFTGAGAALLAAGVIGAGAGIAWLVAESEDGDE